jgi:outer membrane protein insertion porin family
MRGLSNDMKIGMSDTYYLGGPLSLRGFQMRGVGPHSEGDALGSLAYWASGLHLFTPLPFRPGRGGFGDLFKTHLFITAGNVGDFRLGQLRIMQFRKVLKCDCRGT